MNVTIHRGSHQIGGSCVEVVSGEAHVVLDVGKPLDMDDRVLYGEDGELRPAEELVEEGVLPNLPWLYHGGGPHVAAVFVSHAHPDHYGLVHFIHPDIPVLMSAETAALMEVSKIFLPYAEKVEPGLIIDDTVPVEMGPFKVYSFPVDHSAPGAMAFLIEAEGKRVLYTGDFRVHGRQAGLIEKMIEKAPRPIDCLLMEGTTMGRGKALYADEQSVEDGISEILATKDNIAFIVCSSQNLDRLTSIFNAARRTGSLLVIDLYTAYVLHRLGLMRPGRPDNLSPETRIKYWDDQGDKLGAAGEEKFLFSFNAIKIRFPEIIPRRKKVLYLAKNNRYLKRAFDKLPDAAGVELIWSLWDGYLREKSVLGKFASSNNLDIKHIHASGHASEQDLRNLARSLDPKVLVPVHTERPELFENIHDKVAIAEDGKPIEIYFSVSGPRNSIRKISKVAG